MKKKAVFMPDSLVSVYLSWDSPYRPFHIKKLPSGFWVTVIHGEHSPRTYCTERAAKIALIDEVIKNLDDQKIQLRELWDTI